MCLRSILRALTIPTLSILTIASPAAFAAEPYLPLQGSATAGHVHPLVAYPAAGDFSDESPVKLHEVGNWISMADALSTMPTGLYTGVELYFARPTLGEAGTFAVGRPMPNGGEFQLISPAFDYQASPRAYFGWRSVDTGDAVQFGYWHYNNAASNAATVQDFGNEAVVPLLPFGENEPLFNLGDSVQSWWSLNLNVYDVDYLKSLAFVGGRWLVTGSVGVRIADFDQSVRTAAFLSKGDLAYDSGRDMNFIGAGPRLGLEGRRNIGSFFSLYARGAYSILLGSMTSTHYGANYIDNDFVLVNDNRDRTVGVTEIELGASWSPFSNLVISGGYMFQSWAALNSSFGQSVVIGGGEFIGFDGFVFRGVFSY